jgi:hypothetical protein
MGYVDEETVYNLTFADGKRQGLKVQATSVSTGELLELMKLAVRVRESKDAAGSQSKDAAGSLEVVEQLLAGFAEALVSWNIETKVDGEAQPVPATLAGLKSRKLDLVMEIIEAWIEAVSGTPGELGKDSPNGLQYPEGSPMTEQQLANLSSSLTPG